MADKWFIIPMGVEGNDIVPTIEVGGADGMPTHNIGADYLIRLLGEHEGQRQTIKLLTETLEAERNKIRRLMAALADEVTR